MGTKMVRSQRSPVTSQKVRSQKVRSQQLKARPRREAKAVTSQRRIAKVRSPRREAKAAKAARRAAKEARTPKAKAPKAKMMPRATVPGDPGTENGPETKMVRSQRSPVTSLKVRSQKVRSQQLKPRPRREAKAAKMARDQRDKSQPEDPMTKPPKAKMMPRATDPGDPGPDPGTENGPKAKMVRSQRRMVTMKGQKRMVTS